MCFVLNAFDFDGDATDDAYSAWMTTAHGHTKLWDPDGDGLIDIVEHAFAPAPGDPPDLDRRLLFFPSHYGWNPSLHLRERLGAHGQLLEQQRRRHGASPESRPNTALERFVWAPNDTPIHWHRWESAARQRAYFARFDRTGRPIVEGLEDRDARSRTWEVFRYYDRSSRLVEVQRRNRFGGHRVRLTKAADGGMLERHDGAPRDWLGVHFPDWLRPVNVEETPWRPDVDASSAIALSRDPVADFRRLAARRELELAAPAQRPSPAARAGAHRIYLHAGTGAGAPAITTVATAQCPEPKDAGDIDLRFDRAYDAAQRALARQRAAARGDAAATAAAAPQKTRLTIGKAHVDASARLVACRQCSAAHLDALADFAQLRALRIDAPRPDALRAGRSEPRALEQVRYLVLYAQSGKGVGQILKRFPNLRGLWLVTKATPAADLAVLADLRKLRRLNLSATAEAGPLPVLSRLSELEELHVLAQGDADTLSPLLADPPPRLRRLAVHSAPPQLDLSRLARLVELKVICGGNGRLDLGGVARLPHLHTLSVIGCALDAAEPLESARALERLELSHASPQVAAAAFSLERLRVLQIDIRGPEHAQAPPPSLRHLKRLRVLELRAAMTDLSLLGSHPHLQILRLSSVSLRRLDGIERLTALTNLHIDPGEHLSDLSALSQLTRLERLRVTAPSSVADLGALRNLRRLESVTIECPPAADLSPLAGLARLQFLSLSGDSPFGGLCLDFDARGHRDLSPLLSTRRLTHLSLDAREPGADRLARALVGISGFACGETPECEDLFESAPARGGGKPRP